MNGAEGNIALHNTRACECGVVVVGVQYVCLAVGSGQRKSSSPKNKNKNGSLIEFRFWKFR